MSDPLRIALVVEGPTDFVLIQSVLGQVLGEKPFIARILQPEQSLVFGPTGTGWGGVYRWCRQKSKEYGRLSQNRMIFGNFDILIIHLDADVAGKKYADVLKKDESPYPTDGALPCAVACPCHADETLVRTCHALRNVLLSWCHETAMPPNTVICMPSQNMETWVMAAFFPGDKEMSRFGFECHPDPETRIGQQKKDMRFAKNVRDYQARADEFAARWPAVTALCSRAGVFDGDLRSVLR